MGGSSATLAQPLGSTYDQGVASNLQLGNGVTNALISSPSELRTSNIDYLQKTADREATINALKSKQLDRVVNPNVAATREELNRQVNQDLSGGPSTQLSNIWLKQGLQNAIATGAQTDSGFARSALADNTRSDYMTERARLQDRAAGNVAANPELQSGVNPGDLASSITQANSDNANARDAYKSNVLGSLGNNATNSMNAFQQAMQTESTRRSGNASAANTMAGARMSMIGSIIGGGLGAAGGLGGGYMSGLRK